MKLRTIFYLMGQGIINIFKNQLVSIAAVTTITACIFVISILYIVGANVEYMLDSVESNMGISVFFQEETTQDRILEIKTLLEVRSEVSKVTYTSPEEAWERFKSDYFQGKEDQLAGFEGSNPLKDSASLVIFYDDFDSRLTLTDYVNSLPDVRYIRQAEEVVDIMQSFNQLVNYTSLVIVAVLVIISVFLISNTVRLGISTRKKEIEIMKYIGARDSFISGPFIIEGIFIGILGTLIPLALIYYFYSTATNGLVERFELLRGFLVFMDINQIYYTLVPVALAVGVLIGLVGSRLTIGRYLKA